MPSSDVGPDAMGPEMGPGVTVIDLRSAAQRQQQPPHPAYGRAARILPLTLDAIEEGKHGLDAAQGPFVVVCERGTRSALAARYLRVDGLDAHAWAE